MGSTDSDAVGDESDPGAEDDTAGGDDQEGRDGKSEPHPGGPVDVSPALHSAGHEVEDLGFEGVADSAPVLHDDESDEIDFTHRMGADIATRGQDHH